MEIKSCTTYKQIYERELRNVNIIKHLKTML